MVYAMGAAYFNDITTGNNPGCGTSGFYAAENWDPVSRDAARLPPSQPPVLSVSQLVLCAVFADR
jgi:hypothetical protein